MAFKSGDVVQLKSGVGEIMTVDSYDAEYDLVHCVWFSGKDVKGHAFSSNTLKAAAGNYNLDNL